MTGMVDQMEKEGRPPRVAVLLATYNGAAFVGEQIDSILGQQGVTTTIYVRDDGSADATVAIVRSYVETNPDRIFLLADAPLRFGAACGNFLSMVAELHAAPHDFFAFADQDDIWLPHKLARATARLQASGASGYASNLTAFSTTSDRVWVIAKAQPQRRFDHLFQSASAGCTYVFDGAAAALIASRIGRIDDRDWAGMSHDWLCYAICRSYGLSWVIDDWSGIRYRQHEQNLFGAMPGARGVLKRMKMMRDGWYRSVMLANRALLNPENTAEQAIFDRMARLKWRDRLWLCANVRKLRREPRAQLALAGALIAGII